MGAELDDGVVAVLTAPGCRSEIVPDAGHFLQLEQPDVVNAEIVDFLAE